MLVADPGSQTRHVCSNIRPVHALNVYHALGSAVPSLVSFNQLLLPRSIDVFFALEVEKNNTASQNSNQCLSDALDIKTTYHTIPPGEKQKQKRNTPMTMWASPRKGSVTTTRMNTVSGHGLDNGPNVHDVKRKL